MYLIKIYYFVTLRWLAVKWVNDKDEFASSKLKLKINQKLIINYTG